MNTFAISVIRTITPVVVGLVLAGLLRLGIVVDESASLALNAGLDALVIAGYYALARGLETRWPFLGLLLGARAEVTYTQAGGDNDNS